MNEIFKAGTIMGVSVLFGALVAGIALDFAASSDGRPTIEIANDIPHLLRWIQITLALGFLSLMVAILYRRREGL